MRPPGFLVPCHTVFCTKTALFRILRQALKPGRFTIILKALPPCIPKLLVIWCSWDQPGPRMVESPAASAPPRQGVPGRALIGGTPGVKRQPRQADPGSLRPGSELLPRAPGSPPLSPDGKGGSSIGQRGGRITGQATPAQTAQLWPVLGPAGLDPFAASGGPGQKPRSSPPLELTSTNNFGMHRRQGVLRDLNGREDQEAKIKALLEEP